MTIKMKVHNIHFADEQWAELIKLARQEQKKTRVPVSAAQLVRRASAEYIQKAKAAV